MNPEILKLHSNIVAFLLEELGPFGLGKKIRGVAGMDQGSSKGPIIKVFQVNLTYENDQNR